MANLLRVRSLLIMRHQVVSISVNSRICTDTQLKIPFHVGKNASITWLITKTGSALSLKHDHRHSDGSSDVSTMYGGQTTDAGWPQVQTFPVDEYSKELFIRQTIPQSIENI